MLSQAIPPALATGGGFMPHSEPCELAHRWPEFESPNLLARRVFPAHRDRIFQLRSPAEFALDSVQCFHQHLGLLSPSCPAV